MNPKKEFSLLEIERWFKAIKDNDFEVVKAMLKEGFDVDTPGKGTDESSALLYACERGYESLVTYLIAKGANINRKNHFEITPLTAACWKGSEPIVNYLLNKGAEIDRGPNKRDLVNAAWNKHLHIIKILRSKGLDLTSEGGKCVSTLCLASSFGFLPIVKYLLSQGVDIDERDYIKDQADELDNNGRTALLAAIYGGRVETVKFLLLSGANINMKDKKGEGVLEYQKLSPSSDKFEILDVLRMWLKEDEI